jgi:hypothetical protein
VNRLGFEAGLPALGPRTADPTHKEFVPFAREISMQEWLTVAAELTITGIHAMALLIVVFGTLQAFVKSVRVIFNPSPTGRYLHPA